jgi:hypothetical protein
MQWNKNKSAIHLKPLESSDDFDNWKAAFRKIVSIPAKVEKLNK